MNFDMEKTWKERYNEMKKHYGWTDTDVANICGYKSRESLRRSLDSAKTFPLMGMICVFEIERENELFNDPELNPSVFE